MIQVYYVLFTYGVGYSALQGLLKVRPLSLLVPFLAFPFGIAVISILALFFNLLCIPINIFTSIIPVGILSVYFFVISYSKINLYFALGYMILIGLVLALFEKMPVTILSYDSIAQIWIGQALGYYGYFHDSFAGNLSGWGPLLLFYEAVGHQIGVQYYYILPQAIYLSFIFLFGASLYYVVKPFNYSKIVSLAFCLLITLICFLTYNVFHHMFYYHNNLLTGLFFFSYYIVAAGIQANDDWREVLVAGILVLATSLMRTETAIFAALFTWLLFIKKNDGKFLYVNYMVFFVALFITAWNISLLNVVPEGSDILTPSRVIYIFLPMWLVWLSFWLVGKLNIDKVLVGRIGSLILVTACIGLVIFFLTRQPEHMLKSIRSIWSNMNLYWKYFGPLAFGLLILTYKFSFRKSLYEAIVCYVLLLLVLGMFRAPFRQGFGDSANRIFLHFYLLTWFGVIASLFQKHRFSLKMSNKNK